MKSASSSNVRSSLPEVSCGEDGGAVVVTTTPTNIDRGNTTTVTTTTTGHQRVQAFSVTPPLPETALTIVVPSPTTLQEEPTCLNA